MSKASETRLNILTQAFELVYRRGYQATSVDDIIAKTNVTKGAFFYHFKSKDVMGLAMIKEVMFVGMQRSLLQPLISTDDPINEIFLLMKAVLYNNFFDAKYGCPAMNLVEEMAPVNDEFKKELGKLVRQFQLSVKKSVARAIEGGQIRKNVNPADVAMFVATGYSGIRNMGKIYGRGCYESYLNSLKLYLQSLK